MFFGRENELQALETMYQKKTFEMLVMYGRRRIGKTYLLQEFVKNKNFLYLPAEEVNDALNLKKFTHLLETKLGTESVPVIANWHDFFEVIYQKLGDQKLVLIIDEYPYAASANKSLNSTLQHVIDHQFKNTNIFLILCGSSMSFMEEQVLGMKSPLFGRRTGQLKIKPLNYWDAAKFYPHVSNEDKVRYYACFGGTPYYLSLINQDLSFEENLYQLFFTSHGYLNNEGSLLMKQEFREPANYNAILQAIACGYQKLNEIVDYTKLDSNLVSRYLVTLQELYYLERIIPFGANPLKGKTSHYRIQENFLAFWYRFCLPFRSEIENGYGKFYHTLALENLSSFIGTIFEEITKQYLRKMNFNYQLPFLAKTFSTWWGKDQTGQVQEIDIIVESLSGQELLIGECKWRNDFPLHQTIDTLQARSKLFKGKTIHPYLFVKKKLEQSIDGITVVTIDDFYS